MLNAHLDGEPIERWKNTLDTFNLLEEDAITEDEQERVLSSIAFEEIIKILPTHLHRLIALLLYMSYTREQTAKMLHLNTSTVFKYNRRNREVLLDTYLPKGWQNRLKA